MSATVKHIISLTGFQVEIVEDVGLSQNSLEITVIPTESAQVVGASMGTTVVNRRKRIPVKSLTGENLQKLARHMKISYMLTRLKSTRGESNA